jgi:RNA-directed DNA polymerase
VLANLTLDGLEQVRENINLLLARKGPKAKVHLTRYADDFVLSGSSQDVLEHEVKPIVVAFLQERGRELSAEKTAITRLEDGFDFLGQNVRTSQGKLLIKPSKESVQTL